MACTVFQRFRSLLLPVFVNYTIDQLIREYVNQFISETFNKLFNSMYFMYSYLINVFKIYAIPLLARPGHHACDSSGARPWPSGAGGEASSAGPWGPLKVPNPLPLGSLGS
jgi:hypothetical protein